MRVYFTSDTHFGHSGILSERMRRPRPFASIEQHDEHLIAAWNNRIRPGDEVWHLGDFAYGASAAHCRSVFSRLNGRKRLVLGNHDAKRTTDLPWYSQTERAEVVVEGRRFVLSHYAMRTWDGLHRGALHLYGHSHGSLPGCGRSIDVGVDCWDWRPVTVAEILEGMEADAARTGGPIAAAALAEAA
ncbi:metallophosphoesterase family protein [Methylobacterium sp. AMS5]|uniref:metallophosphoesterase family protein n=1 Tax=Methylobacterium sp. AMS5 TaxID=925818 RepID=UPI00074F8A46|nr:metallophosphoesterase family protein [Methylobacterium sp. AMS5]AMB45084.1 metallophosphoesterase [Methylobacterium sp. AMS5]